MGACMRIFIVIAIAIAMRDLVGAGVVCLHRCMGAPGGRRLLLSRIVGSVEQNRDYFNYTHNHTCILLRNLPSSSKYLVSVY